MKPCVACGFRLDDEAAFCSKCGRRQDIEDAEPPKQIARPALDQSDIRDRWNAYLQDEIVRGARIETQHGYVATLVYGRPVNHVLHLLLGFITCSAWWFVWAFLALFGGERRWTVSVRPDGTIGPNSIAPKKLTQNQKGIIIIIASIIAGFIVVSDWLR